ncbi:MAG: helix-turn-helix domain-containing protein [Acidimicrobiia bacterium]|nr:helix-turn-helix domain-containing protein [Acidimicrobiia bacterium]MDH4307910.1 helix-turn-helix domain-containing protein [Acidimicrobiia bacterium]MDH5293439.1 helix-turn-helix domain-containing protein [Acidimicrobiia bacterium]
MESNDPLNEAIGVRVRDARRARGWSLLDVEAASNGEFKASVLGAYERGERALSVARLLRLAALFEMAPVVFLPEPPEQREATIDLMAAEAADDRQGETIDRFLNAIQGMRKSGGARAAVRQSDLKVLAALLDPAVVESLRAEVDEP